MRIAVLIIWIIISFLPGIVMGQGAAGGKDGSGAKSGEATKDGNFIGGRRNRGVMDEFRNLEEKMRKRTLGPEIRRKTLENNLIRAMSRVVYRMFYPEKDELLEPLQDAIKNKMLTYDNPTSPKVYYVKYDTKSRTILVRFDYAKDPEFFLQTPKYEKLLVKEKGTNKDHDKTSPSTGGK